MTEPSKTTLNSSIQFIPGVGPKKASILEKNGVSTVEDILYYLPRRYLDRSSVKKIAELTLESGEVTVIGKVMTFGTVGARGSGQRFVMRVSDDTGILEAIFFQGVNYWARFFREGEKVAISGKVTYYSKPQIIHPAVDRLNIEDGESFWNTGRIISLYPTVEEMKMVHLDSRGIRKVVREALDRVDDQIVDYLPEEIIEKQNLIPLKEALQKVHFPANMEERDEAVRRLKYDELFFLQLMLATRRRRDKTPSGVQCQKIGNMTKKFVNSLPYKYTESQLEVLKDIRQDMESEHSMNRLLQGDVGCGKTIIALTAVVMAVESGYQTAMMAPTEILAEQHYMTAKPLLEALNIRVGLLKSGLKRDFRDKTLNKLASGRIDFIVGTHALIQESVTFQNLGLVIIDEQHKFGVMQRSKLRGKGRFPDVLVMTARREYVRKMPGRICGRTVDA
ncbi:MAG: DEAD/DEAH box helicase, partial [FCB group bacterium]|nr:DEAD/DEAH box helicase [FCB group bacterium]